MDQENNFKKLELLYKENSNMFHYYLTLRRILLAGYFPVIASLALGFKWTLVNTPGLTFVCPFVGFGISILFWALDFRIKNLCKYAGKVGCDIEKKLGYDELGHYGAYQLKKRLKKHKLRHSTILRTFYIGSGILMLLFGVLTGFENDKEIPLSQVPKEAVEAAQRAVEGITLKEAEVEEDGRTVYELEGTANGTEYEIEVTADGKVLEVKQ